MVRDMPLSMKAISNRRILGSTRDQLSHESAPLFSMPIDIRPLQDWAERFAVENIAKEGRIFS